MRILIISALFPPFVQGGAEISAHNLATWLVGEGHEVSVLTTAPTRADETWGESVDGYCLYRLSTFRPYTIFDFSKAAAWKKPIWHLQDIFDPRNIVQMVDVLAATSPQLVNIHDLQGLGYNSVKAIAQRDVPVVYTLHDLGLACVKMSMFVNGRECQRYCQVCRITAEVKFNYLKRIKKLAFISPSSANLEKLKSLLPISDFPSYRVLNPNEYPVPRVQRKPGKRLRLLYVGRLHQSKGLDVVLQALLRLDRRDDFTLRVLGSGPDEVALRETYGGHSWIRFEGHVSLQDVADRMANSDLLLVPSLWLENSPGVVIQALGLGLPVMGSDKGGIPELVRPNENGLLVEAGNVDAWGEAISAIIADPARLEPLRLNAESGASQFAKPTIAQQALTIFEDLVRR